MVKRSNTEEGTINQENKMIGKKRKLKVKNAASEPKTRKMEPSEAVEVTKNDAHVKKTDVAKESDKVTLDFGERFPVLKNVELMNKITSVSMTNNQKGRIRQQVRDRLRSISHHIIPEMVYDRIQEILRSSENLTDTELRRLRILYNMLKHATEGENESKGKFVKIKKDSKQKTNTMKVQNKEIVNDVSPSLKKEKKLKKKKSSLAEDTENKEEKSSEDMDTKDEAIVKKEKLVKKKGPKRYVVFIGNLPVDINKEMIKQHFLSISDHIKDVRIPHTEGKKSGIAYLEMENELSYEMALSKHHSMLGNKRINVLYTIQKNGKISKTEAKHKVAKMVALQKSGKLMGSVPLNKKRSQRRKKLKEALAKQTAENV